VKCFLQQYKYSYSLHLKAYRFKCNELKKKMVTPSFLVDYVSYFFTTNAIPHFGHLPGLSEVTSGCIEQV